MLKAERISCSDPKLSDAQTCNFEAIKHTLLVEAAWHHARRWSPLLPTEVAARRGIGPEAARVAAEANRRLHSKAERLRGRGVRPAKANVAVARELAGFVWAPAVCEG